MRKFTKRCVLLVVPFVLCVLWAHWNSIRGPYYYGSNSDPEYCYLFNSLNLLTFHVPTHTDHPGTTLQELGAAVVFARWVSGRLGGDAQPLVESVVRDPEPALRAISIALLVLMIGLLVGLSWRVLALTGSLITPLILQMSFLAGQQLLASEVRVSPEPLLVSAVLAMGLVLAPGLVGAANEEALGRRGTAYLSGATFGFGLVTKVTFLPLALLALILPGKRQRTRFALAALVAAFFFVSPILTQLPRVARWLYGLATHQERYGQGPSGLPDAAAYGKSMIGLYGAEPYLFWMAGFFLAMGLIWKFAPPFRAGVISGPVRRAVWSGVAAIAAGILITAKHAAGHYLVPLVALVSILAMIVADRLRRRSGPLWYRAPAAVAGLVLLVMGLKQSVAGVRLAGTWDREYTVAVLEQLREVRLRPQCQAIGVYRSSLPGFALSFGNDFSGAVHAAVLEKIYPGKIHYNRFNDRFYDWEGRPLNARVRETVQNGGCILMQGWALDSPLAKEFGLEVIAKSRWEQLIRLHPRDAAF